MRIIAGSRRGRKLIAPDGDRVRPTEDRVKEALFSILQDRVEGAAFLDLFAGSGQVGLEALSRGAARAVFVDDAPDSLRLVRDNLRLTGFEGSASVVRADACDFLRSTGERFHIVFLDPPYRLGLLQRALPLAAERTAPDGVIFCEHPREEELPETAGAFRKARVYRYGKISLTCYRAA